MHTRKIIGLKQLVSQLHTTTTGRKRADTTDLH